MEGLVYKNITEFQEKERLDGTEFIAVSATEKINLLEQIQLTTPSTDITTVYPLGENEFYTLNTALVAVEESVRKLVMEISFVRKVNTDFLSLLPAISDNIGQEPHHFHWLFFYCC